MVFVVVCQRAMTVSAEAAVARGKSDVCAWLRQVTHYDVLPAWVGRQLLAF